MKKINDFSVNLRGPMIPCYYEGCGVSFTDWEEAISGTGVSIYEARTEALDNAAQGDWDTDPIEKQVMEELGENKNVCAALSCEHSDANGDPIDGEPCDACESVFIVELYVK